MRAGAAGEPGRYGPVEHAIDEFERKVLSQVMRMAWGERTVGNGDCPCRRGSVRLAGQPGPLGQNVLVDFSLPGIPFCDGVELAHLVATLAEPSAR